MGKTVVLMGHPPSTETKEFLDQQFGSAYTLFVYTLHVTAMKELQKAILGTIHFADRKCDLQSADDIIISPPGVSQAAVLFPYAIEGLVGRKPKLLNLIRVENRYVPCPEQPFVDCDAIYTTMRKRRGSRVMVCSGS